MTSIIDDYEYIAKRWREITATPIPTEPDFETELESELELGYLTDYCGG